MNRYLYSYTANPTWGVIFESSKLKARTSLLPRFSEKRRSSFELWALKQRSKMSPQVGLAVSLFIYETISRYEYISVHMNRYLYSYISIQIWIDIAIHISLFICIDISIHIYSYISIHISLFIWIDISIWIYLYSYESIMNRYLYSYIPVHIWIDISIHISLFIWIDISLHINSYISIHISLFIWIDISIWIYLYSYESILNRYLYSYIYSRVRVQQ